MLHPTTWDTSWLLGPPLYLGREEVDFHDVQGRHAGRCQADGFLQEEQCARDQQPLPEVGPVQGEQEPHGEVGQMGPVEHLWEMGDKMSRQRGGTEPRFTVILKARTVPRALGTGCALLGTGLGRRLGVGSSVASLV